jgi:hypothetical protein
MSLKASVDRRRGQTNGHVLKKKVSTLWKDYQILVALETGAICD